MMIWITSRMGEANLAMFVFCLVGSFLIVQAAKARVKKMELKYNTSGRGKRQLVIAQDNLITARFMRVVMIAIPILATAVKIIMFS